MPNSPLKPPSKPDAGYGLFEIAAVVVTAIVVGLLVVAVKGW